MGVKVQICKFNFSLRRLFLRSNDAMKAGENLFMCTATYDIPGQDPVNLWYSDVDKYNFGSEPKNIDIASMSCSQSQIPKNVVIKLLLF